MLEFQTPYFGFLILLLPVLFYIRKNNKKTEQGFVIPVINENIISESWKSKFIFIDFSIRILAIITLVLALMQPVVKIKGNSYKEGIDIAVCLDVSNSMLSDIKTDLTGKNTLLTRLEASKTAIINFINKRKDDRIALIAFAGESVTLTPLTIKHNAVIENIKNLKTGILQEGTAIGLGLTSAIARLRLSKNATKVIILLTDGSNNTGEISTEEAVSIAKDYGIKIYSIVVGATSKMSNNQEIDIELLDNISQKTSGNLFVANSLDDITNIYNKIDKLEKNKYPVKLENIRIDLTKYILLFSILLVFISFLLRITILKMI